MAIEAEKGDPWLPGARGVRGGQRVVPKGAMCLYEVTQMF